jgi:hypothetical protein
LSASKVGVPGVLSRLRMGDDGCGFVVDI